METLRNNKSLLLLQERSIDQEVFQDMDKFEMTDAERFALSVRLQFPKFSKGFSVTDFQTFIDTSIGLNNLISIGRLSFPNEWQMQLKTKEIREKLIRIGRTKINLRTCWISPLSHSEIRGYIHWIPNAVGNLAIEVLLKQFGEVLFIETVKLDELGGVQSDSRYFAMNLRAGKTMDDIPHFTNIDGYPGFITIRGRRQSCFHCREIGHRKEECKLYRAKLNAYCQREPKPDKIRIRPRGRRYRPSLCEGGSESSNKKRKKRKKQKNQSDNKIATAQASASQDKGIKIQDKNIKSQDKCVSPNKNIKSSVIAEKNIKVQDMSVLQGKITTPDSAMATGHSDEQKVSNEADNVETATGVTGDIKTPEIIEAMDKVKMFFNFFENAKLSISNSENSTNVDNSPTNAGETQASGTETVDNDVSKEPDIRGKKKKKKKKTKKKIVAESEVPANT